TRTRPTSRCRTSWPCSPTTPRAGAPSWPGSPRSSYTARRRARRAATARSTPRSSRRPPRATRACSRGSGGSRAGCWRRGSAMSSEAIKSRIRTIPDHPKPGIQFRDITTLLQDPIGLHLSVQQLASAFKGIGVTKVAGIEARGFILGGAVAVRLEAGFVAVRKAGKLPHTTIGVDYDLEYGTDRVEIHTDAIHRGE